MRPLSDLAHATAFLTRLPVPAAWFGGRPLHFSRCAWAFPLAGAISAVPAAVVLLAAWSALPAHALLPIVLAYATLTVTCGALHEDGVADVADGFWGGATRERRLEIMRDSRTGTYGVQALIVVFAVRVFALADATRLLGTGGDGGRMSGEVAMVAVAVLVSSVVAGKLALLVHWGLSVPARASGSLAKRFGAPNARQIAGASLVGASLCLPALLVVPLGFVFALTSAGLATFAFHCIIRAKIGGHTGDTLGAAAMIGECAFLVGLALTTWRT